MGFGWRLPSILHVFADEGLCPKALNENKIVYSFTIFIFIIVFKIYYFTIIINLDGVDPKHSKVSPNSKPTKRNLLPKRITNSQPILLWFLWDGGRGIKCNSINLKIKTQERRWSPWMTRSRANILQRSQQKTLNVWWNDICLNDFSYTWRICK